MSALKEFSWKAHQKSQSSKSYSKAAFVALSSTISEAWKVRPLELSVKSRLWLLLLPPLRPALLRETPKRSAGLEMPNLEYECQLGYPAVVVAGVDEVGRGCIAGPVVAGAVILPLYIDFEKDSWLLEVDDSKKMSADQRERIAPLIYQWAPAVGIGCASVEEIDEVNIFHASHLALIRAVQALKTKPQKILVDGKFLPKQGFSAPATAVIKGDQKCLSIAAASVVAKVYRDEMMLQLDQKFPEYGFAQHKGYPTPQHARALKKGGVTEVHRRSFKTVSALL